MSGADEVELRRQRMGGRVDEECVGCGICWGQRREWEVALELHLLWIGKG
jgi:hypothetical protein